MPIALSRYRLIVFDWDGTLEDSAGPIVDNIAHTLRRIGKTPPAEAEIRHIIGLSLVEGLSVLYPREDARELARRCRTAAARGIPGQRDGSGAARGPDLFDGVSATLARMSGEGIWLAVATGKSRGGLEHALQRHALDTLFMSTRTADDAHSKPHPEMLLSILDELGVMPAEALMVGDTTYDLDMANSAGVDCVAVTYGVHSVDTLRATGHAKAYISNLASLEACVT